MIENAEHLRGSTTLKGDADARGAVERLGEEVVDQAERVRDVLDRAEFGEFSVLSALLFYRNGWQTHAIRRIRADHGEAFSAEEEATLERLDDLLHEFQIARQYVQTLYLQKELASLSRLLLYVGVPSLLFLSLVMLVYRPGGGVTIESAWLLPGFVVAMAAGFAPLSILFSYVLRASSLPSRMPLVSPFITDG